MPQTLGLLAALTSPLVMFFGLFMVLRTEGLKYRIAWAVLCFVGIGAFWMRASDGMWGFVPDAINILGTDLKAGYYKASIPMGTLVSMFICVTVRRVRLRAQAAKDQAGQ